MIATPVMAGPLLYLLARNVLALAASVAALTVLERVSGSSQLRVGPHHMIALRLAVCLPLVAGAATATFLRSLMSNWERGALRRMSVARAWYGLVILVAGAVLTWAGTTDLHGAFTADSATRNYVGCAGLGMLAASVVPPLYAWIVPTGYAFVAIAAGVTNADKASTWACVLQNDHHHEAFVISLALAVVGLAAFAVSPGPLSIRLPQVQLAASRSKGKLS